MVRILLPGIAAAATAPWYAGAFTPATTTLLQEAVNYECNDGSPKTNTGTPIDQWNTSLITNMAQLFDGKGSCNVDVTNWNTAGVTTMELMFRGATIFNRDLSAWNTASAERMDQMFLDATNFNQDLSAWNTARIGFFGSMFRNTPIFNQDLSGWNTNSAEKMGVMFREATSFNQDLSAWNTANVTKMSSMFYNATSFNQDVSAWNTARVENMNYMFDNATSFNQDISAWNTAGVTTMIQMFDGSPFDETFAAYWDTSSITSNDIFTGGQSCPPNFSNAGGATYGPVSARCPACVSGFEDDGNGNCVPSLCGVVDSQNHGKWSVDIETFHPVDDAIEVVVTEPLSGVPTATYLVSCSEASSPSSTTSGAPFGTISGNDGAVPSDSADCTDEGVKAQTFNVSNLAAFEDIQTFDAATSTFNATYVLSCQLTINNMVVSSKEKTFSVSMADNVPFVFAEGEAEAAGTAGDNEAADVGVDATQFVALTLTDGDSDDTTVTIKRAEVTDFTFGFDAVSANIDPTAYSVAAITNLQFVFDTTPVAQTLDLIINGTEVTGSTNLVGFTNTGGSFSFVLSEDFFEAGATQVTIQGDVQLGITSSRRRSDGDDVFAPMPFEQTFGLDSAEPEVPMLPPAVAGASTVAAGAGAIVSTAVAVTLCM